MFIVTPVSSPHITPCRYEHYSSVPPKPHDARIAGEGVRVIAVVNRGSAGKAEAFIYVVSMCIL